MNVGPLPGKEVPPEPPSAPLISSGEGVLFWQAASSPRITSPCYMWIDLVAESADAALKLVSTRHLPLLLTALSSRGNGIYRCQLLGARNDREGAAPSSQVKTILHKGDPLEPQRASQIEENFALLSADEAGLRAAGLLHRALSLADSGQDPATWGAALLAYFQVIEVIANRIPAAIAVDYDEQRRVIISNLSNKVGAKTSVSKQATAIRSASAALDRLDARYLSLKIQNRADVLGLTEEWKRKAVEFGKLRNTKLGHGGTELLPQDVAVWLGENPMDRGASWLARQMIDALIIWLRVN
jgi:hypothetical protein